MNQKIFTKPIILVTMGGADTVTEGFAVVERPQLRRYGGTLFIEGCHAHVSGKTVRGRRILLPLTSVTSITEFDEATEIYAHSRKRRKKA